MSWIKDLLVSVTAILITLLIIEAGLRLHGKYAGLASQDVGGVDTIWTREPHQRSQHMHPDLGTKIIIQFDQYGSRAADSDDKPKATKVGLFGDSYTENRRIENKFSFGEILNNIFADVTFLNFGVDGFGLEQSYAHYMKRKDKIKLDKVFYLLFSNDLRNTYEVQLFDRAKMAQGYAVLKSEIGDIPWHIKFLSKMHISYLITEGYYKGMSHFRIQQENFASWIDKQYKKPSRKKARAEFRARFHDEYADSVLHRVISKNVNKSDKELIRHFNATLTKWRADVEASGGQFFVLVIPSENTRKLALELGIKNFVQLEGNENFKKLREKPWRFKNDGHWNEYGNAAAALTIIENADFLGFSKSSIKPFDHFIDMHIKTIDTLYKNVHVSK